MGDFAAGGATALALAGDAAAAGIAASAVADVWPLKFYIPVISVVSGGAAGLADGGSPLLWAVLAGAVVLALLCGVSAGAAVAAEKA
jgi:predicted lysophospholipase L1 biosynthesis ABC-type transport system permease subunit